MQRVLVDPRNLTRQQQHVAREGWIDCIRCRFLLLRNNRATMKLSILVLSCVVHSSTAFVAQPSSSRKSQSLLHATVAPSTKTKAPVFDEVCETTGVTLTRFMTEIAMLNPELRELTSLYGAIETSCKVSSVQTQTEISLKYASLSLVTFFL